MDDLRKDGEEVIYKDIIEDDKIVTIIVRLIDADEKLWELSIQGKGNQLTTWAVWFSSSEEAMGEGMSAILKEGVNEFYSNPEFEYNL